MSNVKEFAPNVYLVGGRTVVYATYRLSEEIATEAVEFPEEWRMWGVSIWKIEGAGAALELAQTLKKLGAYEAPAKRVRKTKRPTKA